MTVISEVPYRYLAKYARTDSTWLPTVSSSTVTLARQTLDAIRHQRELTIPMLQSVVSLTEHPQSLKILNDATIVQACILRLVRLQQQDSLYPFGYEDGYLIFRIIVLSIGVMIISINQHRYGIIIDALCKNERMEDRSVVLMEYVEGYTAETICQFGEDSEMFLGWSPNGMFQVKPIISKPNALVLLNILYKDRKGFLKAWASTHAPALLGILWILWRGVEIANSRDRCAAFFEVFMRYYIVAGKEHTSMELTGMTKRTGEMYQRYGLGNTSSGRVDLEDERNILKAFTDRISSNSILYPIPNLADIGTMLGFVVPNRGLYRGTEDLFIPLIRPLYEYFWLTAGGKTLHNKFSPESEDIATTINPAYIMLQHLHNHAPQRVHEFTGMVSQLGVMEILSRGLVLIKKEKKFTEEEKFRPFCTACNNFTSMLAMVDPARFRVDTFADAFAEWYKALLYMRAQDGLLNTRTQSTSWYKFAEHVWTQAGEFLEYDELVKDAESYSSGCAYSRCPDPNSIKGVQLECACEQKVVYCGPRCQKADWTNNDLSASHRHDCQFVS